MESELNPNWDGRLPVDTIAFATSLGVSVAIEPIEDLDQEGVVGVVGPDRSLRVQAERPPVKQRYIIVNGALRATEGRRGALTSKHFRYGTTLDDDRLNTQTLQVLMPKDALVWVFQNVPDLTIGKVEALFGVSRAAVLARTQGLGLLDNL